MNKLRSVNTKFWEDPFVEDLSPSEKLLFLYFLTNPLTNLIGVYEISIKRMSYDTGLNKETISKGLESFERAGKAFFMNNYIILPNFLKNQNLNANMKVAVIKAFNALPDWLKNSILGNGSEGLPNGSEGFQIIRESFGKLKLNMKLNNKSEDEIEEKPETEKGVNVPFDDFWNLYDKKIAKPICEKKWKSLREEERTEIMKTLPEWLKQFSDKKYQPNPQTYLNQKRWEDEIIPLKPNGKQNPQAEPLPTAEDHRQTVEEYFQSKNK